MKLGSETGSLVNHLETRCKQPEPTIGMAATICGWTDRHGATVIGINKKGIVGVREDKATRIDKNGMSECQEYSYEPNPAGRLYYFRKNKNGRWEEVRFNEDTNRWNKAEGGGMGLALGYRDEYYDFSF